MNIKSMEIPDVLLVEPRIFPDDRGFFTEIFNAKLFAEAGLPNNFVQDNYSGSKNGVLRGLHYQLCHAQGKLVRCTVGEIFDVAVDIRRSSPTFGQWVGVRLSSENKRMLWVPEGFAHGFYTISEWAEVFYKVTDLYAPECERTLLWNDKQLAIGWPIDDATPIISQKDAQGKLLADAELFA